MATIMLDAGHGGYDSGAVYGDRYEKNDTLSLVLAVGLRIAVMRITLFPFIVIPARIQTHIPE